MTPATDPAYRAAQIERRIKLSRVKPTPLLIEARKRKDKAFQQLADISRYIERLYVIIEAEENQILAEQEEAEKEAGADGKV